MSKYRVLVADDHAIIRDCIKAILEDTEDLEVTGEASYGFELMQAIREQEFDLLLLDISMPGRNGIDLIRLVKAERPHMPILMFTMHKEEWYALRAMQAGASGYLTKESGRVTVIDAMRRVAQGGVYISDKVAEIMAKCLQPNNENKCPHTELSDREFQIFEMLVHGMKLTQIAEEFSLSVKTVSTHKTRLLQKLNITNMSELIRYAISQKLIDPDEMI